MSLIAKARSLGIRHKETCNLFWGEYPYSLQHPIPSEWGEERAARVSRFWELNRNLSKKDWAESSKKINKIHAAHKARIEALMAGIIEANPHLLDVDFYYLPYDPTGVRKTYVTFYLKEEETATRMLENLPNSFSAVSAPTSGKTLAIMREHAGKKVVVRKRGWYAFDKAAPAGGFDLKVKMKRNSAIRNEIINRVENIKFEYSSFTHGADLVLYLKGDDDLMLATLAMGEYIDSVTRCVIVGE